MPRLAFLGAGNLASAIVRGLLAKEVCVPADVACMSKGGETASRLASETGIAHEPDLGKLLGPVDTVVVAFKPQSLASADARIAELTRGKLVLSVLAGKKLATLARTFPQARNIVRAMPNTPAAIGAAFTATCSLAPLTPADAEFVARVFTALGTHVALDESHFDAITAVSGSGPAFVFEFVAGLRDAGIAAGLPPDVAYRAALETTLGAARLLARDGQRPEVLRDKVTSPNGTTFAGLQVLAQHRFRDLLVETISAATRRATELSRDASDSPPPRP
jgi:pyrroline-5-carboxylate reductase